MKNFSVFQIVIFVLCGLGILFAVLMFSGKINVGGKSQPASISGTVTVWGVLPYSAFEVMDTSVRAVYKNVTVTYVEKQKATFRNELINALASGEGPDLVIITPADIVQDSNKLLAIPYTSLPDATFRSTFIDQGSLFLNSEGTLAFPLFVDPMIMYYNRDMLTSSFIVNPPATWDELIAITPAITKKDPAGRLLVQTVAMGVFDNITHAKDMLALLLFQAGNRIVEWDAVSKKYVSVFGNTLQDGTSPATNALAFYTSFTNPLNTDRYSWNPTLRRDKDQFIAGNLAIYFGYASEIGDIREKNPNLNFDIALMPQRSATPVKSTFGTLYGIGVVKASKNPTLALTVAQQITTKESITAYLEKDSLLVPARRDLITGASPNDARKTIIYNSGIISRSWVDPDSSATTALFKRSLDQINAGSATPGSIIAPMNTLITNSLQKFQKDGMPQ